MFPKSIAIIDDELEMEDVYAMVLDSLVEKSIAKVHFFSDARDFLEWYDGGHIPDLVLCDINMPVLSGPELCEIIRKTGQGIQIYFVSGDEEREHSQCVGRLKINRFIPKPLNLPQLLSVVEEDLGLMRVNS